MKGYLKFFVLKQLLKKPSTGYSIAKELQTNYGLKPSPGSLYPLLAQLKSQGLISIKEKEKTKSKKVYVITSKGRAVLAKIEKEKEKIIDRVKAIHAMLDPDFDKNITIIVPKKQLIESLAPEFSKLTTIISKKISKKNVSIIKEKILKLTRDLSKI